MLPRSRFFALLPTFLFVRRALFGKKASTRTHEARPDTLVGRGLGAIRALWSAWRVLEVFFFRRGEWIRRFPWFQYERHYFVPGTYVSGKRCLFSSLGSHEL